MRTLILCLVVTALLALPAAADNFAGEVVAFLGNPDGATLMLVHGSAATGAGLAYSYNVGEVKGWTLDLDVGIVQSSVSTEKRIVPGVSISPPILKGSVRPFIGLAATPDEYGTLRIGSVKLDAAVYGGFRKVF